MANLSEAATSTAKLYLPLVSKKVQLSERLGYGVLGPISNKFIDIESVRAGWYVDWTVRVTPRRPNGMRYAQMVRLHQKLACPLGSANAWNRTLCPYEDDYILFTPTDVIVAAATANRGSLWLIGNEMERRDFQYCYDWPTCNNAVTLGQDEILPEMYANAYHDVYHLIKNADPTAQVAIGGVIQPTPLRLEYLSRIWDSYQSKYGTEMPVDVWNVHIFTLREERNGYGADIPAGLSATQGAYTESDCTHLSKDEFDRQTRAMRQWMKDRGQQNKLLIVSEYGPLYHQIYTGTCDNELDPAQQKNVQSFMTWTFDYFLNTKDTEIGYPADDYRLVQMWNWFSLNHAKFDAQGNILEAPLNAWTSLYNIGDNSLTKTGKAFKQYSLDNLKNLSKMPPGLNWPN